MSPAGNLLIVLATCLVISISLNLLLRYPADRLGLVDSPGGRKRHNGRVPLVGGIAIYVSYVAGVYFLGIPGERSVPLLVGMTLLFVCGVLDDLLDLRNLIKLAVQIVAALLMMFWGGQVVQDLGNIAGLGNGLGIWGYPFTLLVVVGLINAINMMDGLDGLAGGVVLTSLFWLGVLAAAGSMGSATLFVLIMAVAVLGFLIFNARHPWRSRASVFLGDAGSMVLGFALAWFAAKISQNVAMVISPVSLAWILALPVVDTVSLMVRRIGKGRSPLAPDREHLHHVFRRAGFSSGATTLLLITLNLILGAVGVFGAMLGVPDTLLFIGFLLLFPCHYYFVRHAWKSARMLRNLQQPTVSERAYSDDA